MSRLEQDGRALVELCCPSGEPSLGPRASMWGEGEPEPLQALILELIANPGLRRRRLMVGVDRQDFFL